MYSVDVYLQVRRAVMVEGMSIREASRVFSLHWDTVRKILAYASSSTSTQKPASKVWDRRQASTYRLCQPITATRWRSPGPWAGR